MFISDSAFQHDSHSTDKIHYWQYLAMGSKHDSHSTDKIHYWQYLAMGSKLGVVIYWLDWLNWSIELIDWQCDLELNLVIEAFGRYKNLLRVEQSGVRNPVEAEFSGPVQTVPKIHPVLCTLGIGSFPGGKTAGAWRWPPNAFLVPNLCMGRAIRPPPTVLTWHVTLHPLHLTPSLKSPSPIKQNVIHLRAQQVLK